jgi:hypothetical protein
MVEKHVASVGLEKIYGNIPTEILWEEMENIDINPVLIEATINL